MAGRKPGGPKTGGRQAGTPNKTTATLKQAILLAADQAGADMNGKDGLVGYCRFLAVNEPKSFANLLGKVLPMQMTGADDEDGNPTAIMVSFVKRDGEEAKG